MVEMKQIILAVIGIVVGFTLVSAVIPDAVTTMSNTANITDYDTWSGGTQNMYETIPLFGVLAVLLIFVGIAVKAVD